MQIPVLVEPLPDGRGFRARAGHPIDLAAEGPTRAAALHELEQATQGRLARGAEIVAMNVPAAGPWVEFGGFLPDDDATARWMDILRENRTRANESPDGLLPPA